MQKPRMSNSIGFRLTLTVVAAVFAGVLISVSFFLVSDFRQTIAAERERLQSSATAFAAALSDSVAIADQREALEVLRGIRSLAHVSFAVARLSNGQILAELGTGTMLIGRDGSLGAKNLVSTFFAETLSVETEVRKGGSVVGTLEIQAKIGWLRNRYLQGLVTALAFGLLLMLATALVARMSIARIIAPLRQLADEFTSIGERSDLAKRLQHDRDDEVGVLVNAFNTMFSRIDDRDQQLRRHREMLEDTVEVRTAEMRVARDEAERANAAKSDFLATMSHEIRTPMNGMMVMAEMLSVAQLSERHRRYADIIMRSGNGLLNIINDILDFSKIDAGRLELEAIPFSIDTLVEDVASLFCERAREKNLTIALLVAPDVPTSLIGDPTRINQVITNLVNNALKFTEVGGVTIDVSSRQTVTDCLLEIHVRDTGIGIAADKIGQIFERFTQADQTITRKFGGTGLGLAIAKRLVEAMGGQIMVSSERGRGTDFCVKLSLAVETQADPMMLNGVAVQIIDGDPVTAAAARKAMLARGAELVSSKADTVPRVILARIGDESGGARVADDTGGPTIAMRPFYASHGATGADDYIGEMQLPLRRAELNLLAGCLKTGDFRPLCDANAAYRTPVSLPNLSGLAVLGVDDTAVNREVLKEALGGFGIEPDLAASGEEAIEKVRSGIYDLIFMDCSMPGMDGYAATEAIRAIEEELDRRPSRIVALTAHAAGADAHRWKVAGFDGYVTKPFNMPQMALLLESLSHAQADGSLASRDAAVNASGPAEYSSSAKHVTGEKFNDYGDHPLLAPETLSMFATLSGGAATSVASRIFELFQQHAPKGMEELRVAIAGDLSQATGLAHALKSMCISTGAKRAAVISGDIEISLKGSELVVEKRIVKLAETIQLTIDEMQKISTQDVPTGSTRAV